MDSIGGGVGWRWGGVGWCGVGTVITSMYACGIYVMLRWCNVLARLHIYAVLRWCNVLARLHIYAVLRWCNVLAMYAVHIYAVLRWCNVLARLHMATTCEMGKKGSWNFSSSDVEIGHWKNDTTWGVFGTWMSKIHGCVNPCYHVFGQNWLYIDGSNHEILAIFLEYV